MSFGQKVPSRPKMTTVPTPVNEIKEEDREAKERTSNYAAREMASRSLSKGRVPEINMDQYSELKPFMNECVSEKRKSSNLTGNLTYVHRLDGTPSRKIRIASLSSFHVPSEDYSNSFMGASALKDG